MRDTRMGVVLGKKEGKAFVSLIVGLFVGAALCFFGILIVHSTSKASFCLSCHEMRPAGADWKVSAHYANSKGVVAECKDCHIKPGLIHEILAKMTDGTKDLMFHIVEKPNPTEEVRSRWRASARKSISDESCRHCHKVLIPPNISKGGIIAHMTYRRSKDQLGLKCIKCHFHRFHGPKPAYGTL